MAVEVPEWIETLAKNWENYVSIIKTLMANTHKVLITNQYIEQADDYIQEIPERLKEEQKKLQLRQNGL